MLFIKNLLGNVPLSKPLSWYKVGGVLLLSLFIFTVPYTLVLNLHSSKQVQLATFRLHLDQKQALTQLNQIESHLTQLSSQMNKAYIPRVELQALHQQLSTIQNHIVDISKQTEKLPTQQIAMADNQKLAAKLEAIQRLLVQLKSPALSPHPALRTLPFHILGIDIWNGQPMATVHMKGEFTLMAVNDTCAGWTLTSIDFETKQVVFKSPQHQYLKIKL
jgi:hypothetical protein